jgi:hypothetical protein
MLRKMMFSSFVNKCHENQKSKLLKIVLSTAKILPISNDQKTIKNHHLMSYFSSEKKNAFFKQMTSENHFGVQATTTCGG